MLIEPCFVAALLILLLYLVPVSTHVLFTSPATTTTTPTPTTPTTNLLISLCSEVSKVVRDRVAAEVSAINKAGFSKNAPRLDVIIVGDRPDSATYVRMKVKACVEVGLEQKTHQVPASVTQSELQALVTKLSADPAVHGILVQLPLPNHLRQGPVIECIAREKDVDGLTTANGGLLFRDGIKAPMIPVRKCSFSSFCVLMMICTGWWIQCLEFLFPS